MFAPEISPSFRRADSSLFSPSAPGPTGRAKRARAWSSRFLWRGSTRTDSVAAASTGTWLSTFALRSAAADEHNPFFIYGSVCAREVAMDGRFCVPIRIPGSAALKESPKNVWPLRFATFTFCTHGIGAVALRLSGTV